MILAALLLAQITPTQPMPRGTGLPPAADAGADPQVVLACSARWRRAIARRSWR